MTRVQNQMVVIAHQAVGQGLHVEAVGRVSDHTEQPGAVHVIDEDRFPTVTT